MIRPLYLRHPKTRKLPLFWVPYCHLGTHPHQNIDAPLKPTSYQPTFVGWSQTPMRLSPPLLHMANLVYDTSRLSSGKYENPFSIKTLNNEDSTGEFVQLSCSAHMGGLPLNYQLTELGAPFIRSCTTAPLYRFYALPGSPPERPGLVRQIPGASIQVEIWEIPVSKFGGASVASQHH